MYIKQSRRDRQIILEVLWQGYSAIELMLVLAVIGLVLSLLLFFSNILTNQNTAYITAQQAYNYSQVVKRYIFTHTETLIDLLSQENKSNGKIFVFSPELLEEEHFISTSSFRKNNLNQYPCTIIYYDKNQLQSFVYYRSDGDDKKLSSVQLHAGLNHVGAMLGLYHDGVVLGAARDWGLDENFTSAMFIATTTALLPASANTSLYSCKGIKIANDSYVVNVTTMIQLNQKLADNNSISQFADVLHGVEDVGNSNRMNNDLSLDYVESSNTRTQSNIVFQMNPNCVLDPNKPQTMQDYDPLVDGNDPANTSVPNSFGCKNRQLAIASGRDLSGNLAVVVTGFESSALDASKYLGEVRAISAKPTALVAVGTSCLPTELGKMAQQSIGVEESALNNQYLSQVQCTRAPTCPITTDGYCYLPVQTLTNNYRPNSASFTCPSGMFYESDSVVITTAVAPYSSYNEYGCYYRRIGGGELVGSNQLLTKYAGLYNTLTLAPTAWVVYCGDQEIGNTETFSNGVIVSVDCTDDPSKASTTIIK